MSIAIYYGVEISANDFNHLIITTGEHDSLPLEVDIWSTFLPIDQEPQELIQEGEPLYVDDCGVLIFNPPPTQLARQSNVIIGVEVVTLNNNEANAKSKLIKWSNFETMDKSQIDDMMALICMDLGVPIQEPKYITVDYMESNNDESSNDIYEEYDL